MLHLDENIKINYFPDQEIRERLKKYKVGEIVDGQIINPMRIFHIYTKNDEITFLAAASTRKVIELDDNGLIKESVIQTYYLDSMVEKISSIGKEYGGLISFS